MESADGPEIEGRYANFFRIAHTRNEFLVAFGQVLPGDIEPSVSTRVVTSPSFAQELWRLLGEALVKYREMHGAIKDVGGY